MTQLELKDAFEHAEVPETLDELNHESEDRDMQKKADEMLEKWFPEFRGVDDYARDEDEGALGGDEGDGPRAQFSMVAAPSPATFPLASGIFGAGDASFLAGGGGGGGGGGGFAPPVQDAAGHFRFDVQPAAAGAAQQGWGGGGGGAAAPASAFAPHGGAAPGAPAAAPFTFAFNQQ